MSKIILIIMIFLQMMVVVIIKSSFVRIENFSDSSIDMLVECFVNASEWVKFIETKEKACYTN